MRAARVSDYSTLLKQKTLPARKGELPDGEGCETSYEGW